MESVHSYHNRSDFLWRGLEVLANDGPDSLSAARLSRELDVTTGSFYWHFKTVDVFRNQLIRFWLDEVVMGIIAEAQQQPEDGGNVLVRIGQIVRQRGTHRYDTAMRDWAGTNKKVSKVVKRADAKRHALIKDMLKKQGESDSQATDRANLLGAAWRGTLDMKDAEYRMKLMGIVTGKPQARA